MASELAQSKSELQEKLETYRDQLQQVEAALVEAPTDEALLNLKNDLQEVVNLTEDLVQYQDPAEQPQKEKESKSTHKNLVGRTCEILHDGKWYNSEVKSVRRDNSGIERCQVQLLAFKTLKEVKVNEIKLLKPPHPALCQPGAKLQAIFGEDGLWYDAVVTEQTETGYKVAFTEYGNKEDIGFDRVRKAGTTGRTGQTEKKRNVKEIVTPAGYRIPDNLMTHQGDSEETIARKRRKIRSLKHKQRDEMEEKEHVKQSAGWQKFTKKASAQSKTGFLTGRKKESIFKVPDSIEGKVGVTNSGSAMTTFGERQKFTYN